MEKLFLRRSARRDSERIEELVHEYYLELVPVLDGFSKEEETVCKKIVDKEGNIIAGCLAIMYCWNVVAIDIIWVDEQYRGGKQHLRQRHGQMVAVEKGGEGPAPHHVPHGEVHQGREQAQ